MRLWSRGASALSEMRLLRLCWACSEFCKAEAAVLISILHGPRWLSHAKAITYRTHSLSLIHLELPPALWPLLLISTLPLNRSLVLGVSLPAPLLVKFRGVVLLHMLPQRNPLVCSISLFSFPSSCLYAWCHSSRLSCYYTFSFARPCCVFLSPSFLLGFYKQSFYPCVSCLCVVSGSLCRLNTFRLKRTITSSFFHKL